MNAIAIVGVEVDLTAYISLCLHLSLFSFDSLNMLCIEVIAVDAHCECMQLVQCDALLHVYFKGTSACLSRSSALSLRYSAKAMWEADMCFCMRMTYAIYCCMTCVGCSPICVRPMGFCWCVKV